jgi:hypothetical protein
MIKLLVSTGNVPPVQTFVAVGAGVDGMDVDVGGGNVGVGGVAWPQAAKARIKRMVIELARFILVPPSSVLDCSGVLWQAVARLDAQT